MTIVKRNTGKRFSVSCSIRRPFRVFLTLLSIRLILCIYYSIFLPKSIFIFFLKTPSY